MKNIWLSAWKYCDLTGKIDIIILLLFSIYSWYIMIEKFFVLREVKKKSILFENSISKGKKPTTDFSPLHNVFHYGTELIKNKELTEEKFITQLEKSASVELEKIESRIGFLSVISTVSPFLGLLGTVWGLLLAFNNMAISGSSSIRVVASGVAEALITTVIGLIVAIPAAIGYHYFTENLKKIAGKIDFLLPQIVMVLKEEKVTK